MEQKEIKVEVADIDDLIQDDRNFNKGTEEGARLIERSFTEHGAGRSVFIDRDNRLVGGNKAQKGFKAAGKKKVIIVDSDADTLVAVRRKDVSLDTAEGRQMAYLDNLTTQVNLSWDQTELEAVQADVEGFDISDYGIDLGFADTADPDEADKVTEDDFDPDQHYEPVTQPGDIIMLGDHRLMCGDSTKPEDVQRLMQGEKADLWLTDPPYNVDYNQKYNDMLDAGVGSPNSIRHEDISNDKMSDADFDQFLINAFSAANNVMKAGCSFYVWTAQGHILTQFAAALDKVGLEFRQQVIWRKNTFVPGRSDYQWIHEPCFYGWKAGAAHYFTSRRDRSTVYSDGEEIDIDKMKKSEMQKLLHDILDNRTPISVFDVQKPARSEYHPTMKPVRLFGYQMANSSRPGDIILDTFGGSGTTIVAAEQLSRRARLMELDPKYCDVIIARWEKLTGRKAEKTPRQ